MPDVAAWLAESGRKDVIIGGISIENCVLHTALDLLRADYNVFVVTDVSGTNSALAEQTAFMRLRDAGAVLTGWLAIATELGVDFASPYGEGLKEIIGTHWPASTTGIVEDTMPDGRRVMDDEALIERGAVVLVNVFTPKPGRTGEFIRAQTYECRRLTGLVAGALGNRQLRALDGHQAANVAYFETVELYDACRSSDLFADHSSRIRDLVEAVDPALYQPVSESA